ncbi:MAG: hypothetical protein JNN15_13605, partial [Blastocatellia bacterium]|nr:hypothetical protein [Blastocatellia bacterium]
MTNNQNFEPTQSETELGSVEEARIETELDLLTDQARVLATHMLSEEKSNLDNH